MLVLLFQWPPKAPFFRLQLPQAFWLAHRASGRLPLAPRHRPFLVPGRHSRANLRGLCPSEKPKRITASVVIPNLISVGLHNDARGATRLRGPSFSKRLRPAVALTWPTEPGRGRRGGKNHH